MSVLVALRNFVIDLVIGDDPKIAVAVVVSLALAASLMVAGVVSPSSIAVVGAAAVVVAFTVSLIVDTRQPSR